MASMLVAFPNVVHLWAIVEYSSPLDDLYRQLLSASSMTFMNINLPDMSTHPQSAPQITLHCSCCLSELVYFLQIFQCIISWALQCASIEWGQRLTHTLSVNYYLSAISHCNRNFTSAIQEHEHSHIISEFDKQTTTAEAATKQELRSQPECNTEELSSNGITKCSFRVLTDFVHPVRTSTRFWEPLRLRFISD